MFIVGTLSDFRTRTPKGDGNQSAETNLVFQFHCNFRTRTPKGDGNTLTHFLNSEMFTPNFRTRTPKGDGNGEILACYVAHILHFRTRTPKGDGNGSNFQPFDPLQVISEHEPRKGTETKILRFRSTVLPTYFRTRTPKGDGNLSRTATAATSCNFRTRTPKGDGNVFGSGRTTTRVPRISEHEPRKGTETCALCMGFSTTSSPFQNTNPERGRKLQKAV